MSSLQVNYIAVRQTPSRRFGLDGYMGVFTGCRPSRKAPVTCQSGLITACCTSTVAKNPSLGVAYANGYGVSEDKSEAVRWWRKATDQGDGEAQFNLGAAYRDGAGVPKDNAEAYFRLSLAATGKVEGVKQEDVAKARDEQASHLTKMELSQVQERVQKWYKDHAAKTNSQ